LCSSILLSDQGVSSLLIEKYSGTPLYPKTRGLNPRTMEVFRQCGIEAAVRQASLPPVSSSYAIWADTLADGQGNAAQKNDVAAPDESYDSLTPIPGLTSSEEITAIEMQAALRETRHSFTIRRPSVLSPIRLS
jgi:2-polyprenyl-6-methoxyphenol hydroxylase-like FAD-dependent oxidoreductase